VATNRVENGAVKAHIAGMARDRWETDLKCPKCGLSGHAKISEENHPWVGIDYGRPIDGFSEGFVVVFRKPSHDSDILCVKCNIMVEWT
jgi:hypothetical protein